MVQDKRLVMFCEARQLTGQIAQLEYKCSVEKDPAKLEKLRAQKHGLVQTRANLKNLAKVYFYLGLNAASSSPSSSSATTVPPASPAPASPKSVPRDLSDAPAPAALVTPVCK